MQLYSRALGYQVRRVSTGNSKSHALSSQYGDGAFKPFDRIVHFVHLSAEGAFASRFGFRSLSVVSL